MANLLMIPTVKKFKNRSKLINVMNGTFL